MISSSPSAATTRNGAGPNGPCNGSRNSSALIGVELNQEKTKVVDMLKGEAFGFLGFDLRRVRKRNEGRIFILMTPKKKARKAVKAKIRDIIRRGGATPHARLVKQINATLAGWVNYFPGGQLQSCL